MTIALTIIFALVLFGVAVLALALKPIAGNRTPLKRHACDVMCRHGHDHPCTCSNDGTCSDHPGQLNPVLETSGTADQQDPF